MSNQTEEYAELSCRIQRQEETIARLIEIVAAINQRITD